MGALVSLNTEQVRRMYTKNSYIKLTEQQYKTPVKTILIKEEQIILSHKFILLNDHNFYTTANICICE